MEKITVVINVVNEEIDLLHRSLSSVKNLADEIVIVDMTSSDELDRVSKEFKAVVFKHELVPYVEIARNFGISKSKNDWVLILDPDEVISAELSKTLTKLVNKPQADYYRLPRKNIIFGKWIKYSRWWPDLNIRFFKKGYVSWNEIIHTVPMTTGTGKDLETKEENALVHYHYESVEQFIERMNRYTTALAKNKVEDGYKFDWRDLIEKPVNEFLSRYFQGEGYKDGLHGFALAGLQAFSEMVVFLKLWQFEKFKEQHVDIEEVVNELKEAETDVHYWESDSLLKEVGGLKHRIKRKFKLL